jgi:hypothetical protein
MLPSAVVPVLLAAAVHAPAAPSDADKLGALARLYGVVRWFHPSDAAQELDWNLFAIHAAREVRMARSADELGRILERLFAPVAVDLTVAARAQRVVRPPETPAGARLVWWCHLGLGSGSIDVQEGITGGHASVYTSVRAARPPNALEQACGVNLAAPATMHLDLGADLRARVPRVLTDSGAAVAPNRRLLLEALKAQLQPLDAKVATTDPNVRAADVVVAWSAFRHFYPYWPDVAIDWDARLTTHLQGALAAQSREAHRDVLRRLVAETGDGHGFVRDVFRPPRWLPISVRWVSGRLVVTGSVAPGAARVGDAITAIDGRPAEAWLGAQEALVGGSAQWRPVGAILALTRGPEGTRASLTLERQSVVSHVELTRDRSSPVFDQRPEPLAQIDAGVWYVDLERVGWADLRPRLPDLAGGPAVVLDVRGRPTDAGARILPHLLKWPERARWMHIPCFVEPHGRAAGWRDIAWNLAPAAPHVAGRIAVLTDARAISYAESVVGYVEALGLGIIVGGATAGTNGNVNAFDLPSGMKIAFTGMRVTRHDGSRFHLVGVQPDVRVEPTLEGIRAGRDEVLERALELVGGRTRSALPRLDSVSP